MMLHKTSTPRQAALPLRIAQAFAWVLLLASVVFVVLGFQGLAARGAMGTDARAIATILSQTQTLADADVWAQETLDALSAKRSLNFQLDRYPLILAINQLTEPAVDEATLAAVREAKGTQTMGAFLQGVEQGTVTLADDARAALERLLAAEPVTEQMTALMKKMRGGSLTEQTYRTETLKTLDMVGVLHASEQTPLIQKMAMSSTWLTAALACFLLAFALFVLYDARTHAGKMFDIVNHAFLGLLAAVMVLPLVYVVVGSFSSTGMKGGFTSFSLTAYKNIISTPALAKATGNSILITVAGTLINIVLTAMTAYVLSKKGLPGRGVMLRLVMIFMLFQPGIIPDFMQVNSLGLYHTYWAVWLPVAINASNLLIMKNFFQQLPDSIEESARIDGCNDAQSFVRIVLPMSKASIATFSLFYAVGHWNNYFRSMIYLGQAQWPIQVWLRQLVILSLGGLGAESLSEQVTVAAPDAMKYATIVVATLPIICIYPFLQKHFAKGMLVGSVKG